MVFGVLHSLSVPALKKPTSACSGRPSRAIVPEADSGVSNVAAGMAFA
jgi:hypothetical protein